MAKQLKKSLAEVLLEEGRMTREQYQKIKDSQGLGVPVRRLLLDLQIISEEALIDFITMKMAVPRIELKNCIIDSKIIALVPEDVARKHRIIPVLKIGNALTCAMVDIFDIFAMDEVGLRTGLTIDPAIASESEISWALKTFYSSKDGTTVKRIEEVSKDATEQDLKTIVEEPPVIRMVNNFIMEAFQKGASDVHIEPEKDLLKIRYRIDGILYEQRPQDKFFEAAVVSRVKVLASLDITERRRPQDGRFQMTFDDHQIDIRVSCVPTVYGETVVLRLLDSQSILMGLEEIGLNRGLLDEYLEIINKPNGIILVTGPTGSGKTTTLYATIKTINTAERNIVTIEDPVEYRLAGIQQIQVNPAVDLNFANGLRSILRQDPDIIMVGEIRDFETAEIAIQAALTGHLVFATLHTNNAPSAMTRLLDMGVEPYLLSSSVIAVIAQRLVRLLCRTCSGTGCAACNETGYKGRTAIYEFMKVNDEIRGLINQKVSADVICDAALRSGMKLLREDGLEKERQGLTSKEEVLRVS